MGVTPSDCKNKKRMRLRFPGIPFTVEALVNLILSPLSWKRPVCGPPITSVRINARDGIVGEVALNNVFAVLSPVLIEFTVINSKF